MNEREDLSPQYRIEVSGWDSKDQFFVEECAMEWNDSTEKRISLRSPVQGGVVLFVRLIPPTAGGESFPVVYRVSRVGPRQGDGRREVELAQMRPKPARVLRDEAAEYVQSET